MGFEESSEVISETGSREPAGLDILQKFLRQIPHNNIKKLAIVTFLCRKKHCLHKNSNELKKNFNGTKMELNSRYFRCKKSKDLRQKAGLETITVVVESKFFVRQVAFNRLCILVVPVVCRTALTKS